VTELSLVGFRLFPLLITIGFQLFIMRDVEKFIGWIRVGVIYIISGIAGSLSSGIFLPYHPEVSHSDSIYSLLEKSLSSITNSRPVKVLENRRP